MAKAVWRALLLGLATPGVAQAQAAPVAVVSFDQQAAPPMPDYALPGSWAARPAAPGPAALIPPGATPLARNPKVDVFYVHPTTFRSKVRWNADIADAETNHWTDISVIARQASAFNGCCRVFAPRYRQASLAAFSAPVDGGKAYALAYSDVLRAFDYYLAHDNHGRPFILASHSQGSLMVKRLLSERIAGTALRKRLVAAYVLGFGVVRGDFDFDLAGYRPCAGPIDTGCVLSWNSFLAGSDTAAYRMRSAAAFTTAHGAADSGLLCSDPLALGGTSRSLGALPGEARDGALQALVPGAVTGHCKDGIMLVRPDPALGLTALPGGNMHYSDMALYYADIRTDAVRRARAFLAKGAIR